MDTATALVISLIIISVLTISILIIVNLRIFLIKKKYSTKNNTNINSKNLKENKKDNLNIEKNSIIKINKNSDDQLLLEEEKDYYSYFNLLSLNDLKKALINLEINFDEKQSKDELIFLLLEKLQNGENETKK